MCIYLLFLKWFRFVGYVNTVSYPHHLGFRKQHRVLKGENGAHTIHQEVPLVLYIALLQTRHVLPSTGIQVHLYFRISQFVFASYEPLDGILCDGFLIVLR